MLLQTASRPFARIPPQWSTPGQVGGCNDQLIRVAIHSTRGFRSPICLRQPTQRAHSTACADIAKQRSSFAISGDITDYSLLITPASPNPITSSCNRNIATMSAHLQFRERINIISRISNQSISRSLSNFEPRSKSTSQFHCSGILHCAKNSAKTDGCSRRRVYFRFFCRLTNRLCYKKLSTSKRNIFCISGDRQPVAREKLEHADISRLYFRAFTEHTSKQCRTAAMISLCCCY